MTRDRRSSTLIPAALDIVIPLAVFYLARVAGVDQWLALVLAALAPGGAIVWTWVRDRRLDSTAVFVIACMALTLAIALVSSDPRTMLARESLLTAAAGLWILGSLRTRRPLLLDFAGKITPAGMAARLDLLWTDNPVVRRWIMLASAAWGAAFLVDAVMRLVFAYTLDVDSVPAAGAVTLIVLIVVAQGLVMVHGRRSGALALVRTREVLPVK